MFMTTDTATRTVDIFEKARSFSRANDLRDVGLFPYFKPLEGQDGNRVTVEGRSMLMMGSNDYLGLSQDERVRRAGTAALDEFGTSCTGSRFLNGTLALHESLEAELAAYLNQEAALTFSTGFLGSLSVITALADRHDILYFDRENHASLFDGARLSFGKLRKYRHNDIADLERLLRSDEGKHGGRLVVTDGVFSMSGSVANLPSIVDVAKRYGARIVVDDAHASGVLGANGRGTSERFGLEEEVDLIIGTFSKAFASVGGFVAGDARVVDFVKCVARPFIFTAALPPAQVAITSRAVKIVASEPWHRETLWNRIGQFRDGLRGLGFDVLTSEGPIIPVSIGDEARTLQLWKGVWDAGIFALPALPPSVPDGQCLIRTAVNASHSREEIDEGLAVFADVGRRHRVID